MLNTVKSSSNPILTTNNTLTEATSILINKWLSSIKDLRNLLVKGLDLEVFQPYLTGSKSNQKMDMVPRQKVNSKKFKTMGKLSLIQL
jgi:hypothetical protein